MFAPVLLAGPSGKGLGMAVGTEDLRRQAQSEENGAVEGGKLSRTYVLQQRSVSALALFAFPCFSLPWPLLSSCSQRLQCCGTLGSGDSATSYNGSSNSQAASISVGANTGSVSALLTAASVCAVKCALSSANGSASGALCCLSPLSPAGASALSDAAGPTAVAAAGCTGPAAGAEAVDQLCFRDVGGGGGGFQGAVLGCSTLSGGCPELALAVLGRAYVGAPTALPRGESTAGGGSDALLPTRGT